MANSIGRLGREFPHTPCISRLALACSRLEGALAPRPNPCRLAAGHISILYGPRRRCSRLVVRWMHFMLPDKSPAKTGLDLEPLIVRTPKQASSYTSASSSRNSTVKSQFTSVSHPRSFKAKLTSAIRCFRFSSVLRSGTSARRGGRSTPTPRGWPPTPPRPTRAPK